MDDDLRRKSRGLPVCFDSEALQALIERQIQMEDLADRHFKRGFASATIAFAAGAAIAALIQYLGK